MQVEVQMEFLVHCFMVQLMPLPPIISCFSKIRNGLPFWCQRDCRLRLLARHDRSVHDTFLQMDDLLSQIALRFTAVAALPE